jgi:hypothetical protein
MSCFVKSDGVTDRMWEGDQLAPARPSPPIKLVRVQGLAVFCTVPG